MGGSRPPCLLRAGYANAEVDRCRPDLACEDAGADTRGTGRAPRGRPGYGRRRRYGRPVFAPSQRQRLRKQDSGGSSALKTFAHLGFVARGIAYIVIGVIAVMVALRVARHEPDTAGAIEAIAAKPFGYLVSGMVCPGRYPWQGLRAATAAGSPG